MLAGTFSRLLCLGLLVLATANAFEYVSEPIASFVYGDRTLNIWPCARNGPDTAPSIWCFRYDPLLVPIVDENNTVIITTVKYGSEWRTSFSLALDDAIVKTLAYQEVKESFKGLEGLRLGNVRAMAVKNVVIAFPDLSKAFPDVNLTSVTSFYIQPSLFSVTLISPTPERALELKEVLRMSQAHYEIETYVKLTTISTRDDNPISLAKLQGQIPLSPAGANMSCIVHRLQHIEERLAVVEEGIVTDIQNIKDQLETKFKNISSEINISAANLVNRLDIIQTKQISNLTSTLPIVVEHVLHIRRNLQCPEEWKRFCDKRMDCHCYRYFDEDSTWEAARDKCRSFDSNLVSIHSSEENEFVGRFSTGSYVWIGLNDIESEGNYTWDDRSDVSYKSWASGQPDDGRYGNCVYIYHAQWYDQRCNWDRDFICKRPL